MEDERCSTGQVVILLIECNSIHGRYQKGYDDLSSFLPQFSGPSELPPIAVSGGILVR